MAKLRELLKMTKITKTMAKSGYDTMKTQEKGSNRWRWYSSMKQCTQISTKACNNSLITPRILCSFQWCNSVHYSVWRQNDPSPAKFTKTFGGQGSDFTPVGSLQCSTDLLFILPPLQDSSLVDPTQSKKSNWLKIKVVQWHASIIIKPENF